MLDRWLLDLEPAPLWCFSNGVCWCYCFAVCFFVPSFCAICVCYVFLCVPAHGGMTATQLWRRMHTPELTQKSEHGAGGRRKANDDRARLLGLACKWADAFLLQAQTRAGGSRRRARRHAGPRRRRFVSIVLSERPVFFCEFVFYD